MHEGVVELERTRHDGQGRHWREPVSISDGAVDLGGLHGLVSLGAGRAGADQDDVAQRAQDREDPLVLGARQRPGLVVAALGGPVEARHEVGAHPEPLTRVGVQLCQVLGAQLGRGRRKERLHGSILPSAVCGSD